jgi:serine/threonine protein kinase
MLATGYETAPSDIWSLGVILVNLACGYNPWERASCEDSNFRAYTEDRNFLKSILLMTPKLHTILNRIFELEPSKRITIAELKEMVLCPESLTALPPR